MNDMKVTAIAAGLAFFISFILGLVGRSGFFWSLLKALIFGGVFFGLVTGICFIYNKFLIPKKDDENTEKTRAEALGENLDLTIEDELPLDDFGDNTSTDEAPYEIENSNDSSEPEELEELEYIDTLPLDQNQKEGYNQSGIDVTSHDASNEDIMDIGAFVPAASGESSYDNSKPAVPKVVSVRQQETVEMSMGKKEINLGMNVDGKKMAGAIQTMLSKDEG